MIRIVIAGGPKTGKTTLAARMFERHDWPHGAPDCDGCGVVRHTDDLIHLGWSEASAAAALWFDEPGPWIVEGVATPRALRKWIAAHPAGKPCDVVHWLEDPHVERTPGQVAMANGCATVWREIVDELRARGVEIVVGGESQTERCPRCGSVDNCPDPTCGVEPEDPTAWKPRKFA